MNSEQVFTIAIAKKLRDGKKRYLTAGAIIRDSRGYMYGQIEMLPVNIGTWDGGFYLFPVKEKAKEAGLSDAPNLDEAPF